MDVRVAMNMTNDEIKSKYKEYLRHRHLAKLVRKNSGGVLWLLTQA